MLIIYNYCDAIVGTARFRLGSPLSQKSEIAYMLRAIANLRQLRLSISRKSSYPDAAHQLKFTLRYACPNREINATRVSRETIQGFVIERNLDLRPHTVGLRGRGCVSLSRIPVSRHISLDSDSSEHIG